MRPFSHRLAIKCPRWRCLGKAEQLFDPRASVLLVSAFDDVRSGGLFAFDGSELAEVDRLSSTGLAVGGSSVGRLLRASANYATAELLVYDERGVAEYRRLDAIEDPHDLKRADDGSWLIVSSTNNALIRVDRQGSLETVWQPSMVPDSWHPNSVEVVEGELWVTAFGRFEASRGWAGDQGRGAGFLRNLTTGQELGGLSQPHCPRLVEGQWWVCNSLDRSLVRWDERTEHWERRVSLEGYPRGFAVDGDTMFVGESADRDDPEGLAALVIIQDGSVTDRIPLPCGSIYDVVLAPMAAIEGLRRGFGTNPQRVAGEAPSRLMSEVGQRGILDGAGSPLRPEATATRILCEPPSSMRTGESRLLRAIVHNVGTSALASVLPYPIYLSYRWIDDAGLQIDGARIVLAQALLPGGSASYEIDLVSPDLPGTYDLSISLVQEEIIWLEDLVPTNGLRFRVLVGEDSVAVAGPA
jgi:Domain of unknown function (DUF4915)